MPDLFVSEFALMPAWPVQGQPVEVRVGVYNQGTAAAGTFHVEWYPGEGYPSPGCTWDVDGMAAGGGRILTCTYAGYPSPYTSINTKVAVDSLDVITESNEGNNTYLQAISVMPAVTPSPSLPDLFVSEFSLTPATPIRGQPVEVRIGVYNQGTAAASGTFWVEWYPGENYASPACNWSVDGMAAGGGRILTCTYHTGYPSTYASINTKVMVDTTNVIDESDEGNNTYLQAITVTAP
jgi:subtilase family serine protease